MFWMSYQSYKLLKPVLSTPTPRGDQVDRRVLDFEAVYDGSGKHILMFWVFWSFLGIFEGSGLEAFVSWLPLYNECKICLLLWCCAFPSSPLLAMAFNATNQFYVTIMGIWDKTVQPRVISHIFKLTKLIVCDGVGLGARWLHRDELKEWRNDIQLTLARVSREIERRQGSSGLPSTASVVSNPMRDAASNDNSQLLDEPVSRPLAKTSVASHNTPIRATVPVAYIRTPVDDDTAMVDHVVETSGSDNDDYDEYKTVRDHRRSVSVGQIASVLGLTPANNKHRHDSITTRSQHKRGVGSGSTTSPILENDDYSQIENVTL